MNSSIVVSVFAGVTMVSPRPLTFRLAAVSSADDALSFTR